MVRSYRVRYDIVMDILKAALHGAKKTHIMYRANLNPERLRKYFPDLLANGLIIEVKDSNGGIMYQTTEKGKSTLKIFGALMGSLPRKRL